MLENLACAVSRAKLMEILNVSYNMRLPILMTEMFFGTCGILSFDIYQETTCPNCAQRQPALPHGSTCSQQIGAHVGRYEVRSFLSFLPYIATKEVCPHQRTWTEMQQSWKDWASVEVPLHPDVAGGWSPHSSLPLCLLSYCWPLMGSSSLVHPRRLFIWKCLGQWEAGSLGGRSALGSGHSPYLPG